MTQTASTPDSALDAEQLDMLRASLRHVLSETSPQPLQQRLARNANST